MATGTRHVQLDICRCGRIFLNKERWVIIRRTMSEYFRQIAELCDGESFILKADITTCSECSPAKNTTRRRPRATEGG